jgi:hypothetical protein
LEFTHARQRQHDAIISAPLAPSVYGTGQSIKLNIGEIRTLSTEFRASAVPVTNALVRWAVGGNLTLKDSKVLKLDQRSTALLIGGDNGGEDVIQGSKIAVGYPLFGRWAKPILGYSDANGDGIIELNEIRVGDTSVFLGRQDPGVVAAINTDLTLFHGRLGVHANFVHQSDYSQLNGASLRNGPSLSAANDVDATFAQQAAYVAALGGSNGPLTEYGLAQTVSYWRFESLSLNYNVPTAIARRFRAPVMSIALQGSNLKLWSNYRGKDPNVNALPNGNLAMDGGQLPQPRMWSVQIQLGN